jgi:hypothetical protein
MDGSNVWQHQLSHVLTHMSTHTHTRTHTNMHTHTQNTHLPKLQVQGPTGGPCYMDGSNVRQDHAPWGEPSVSSCQHAVQHGLKQERVAHPLAHYDVNLTYVWFRGVVSTERCVLAYRIAQDVKSAQPARLLTLT